MTTFWENERVLISGAAGFLGRHVVAALDNLRPGLLYCPRSADYDLRKVDDIRRVLRMCNPTMVIHLAARVGGILANKRAPAEFFYDNLIMSTQLLHESWKAGVNKFVTVGTVCFTADTLIQVGDMFKNISQVGVGDLAQGVISSLVNGISKRSYSGQVFKVKPFSCETLTVTPEHPFLTVKNNDRASVLWKPAEELTESDYLLLKIPTRSVDCFQEVELIDVIPTDWRAKNFHTVDTNAAIPSKLIVDEDLAWFLGMFIAEGTVAKDRQEVYLSFGNEPDIIERVKTIVENKFNLKTTLRKMPNQEGYQLNFYGRKLGTWLQEVCYLPKQRGARAKRVPGFIFRSTDNVLVSFLQGCFQGDGCISFRSYVPCTAINSVTYSSVSRTLIYQLKNILLWFKCLGSIHKWKPSNSEIGGRTVRGGIHFELKVSGKNTDTFINLVFPYLAEKLYPNKRIGNREAKVTWFQDMVAVPIWSLSIEDASNLDVFNLETTDHTYTANSVVVHNCSYPKNVPVPFLEENLWEGYPEETNAPYGIAKRALLTQCQAYRQQYGFNSIYLIPVNLYGPGDSFDLETSHVIPALIRKCIEAKEASTDFVVWGTGKASREFLYVDDAATGIVMASELYNKPEPVNLGSGQEIPIIGLVDVIVKLIGFTGKIVWDTSMPDGQPRRCLCAGAAKREFGFEAKTTLVEGISRTIEWYEKYRKELQ